MIDHVHNLWPIEIDLQKLPLRSTCSTSSSPSRVGAMMSRVMGTPIQHLSQILPPSLRDINGGTKIVYRINAVVTLDGVFKQHLRHVSLVVILAKDRQLTNIISLWSLIISHTTPGITLPTLT